MIDIPFEGKGSRVVRISVELSIMFDANSNLKNVDKCNDVHHVGPAAFILIICIRIKKRNKKR